jgi:hypothetical protein
MTKDEIQKVTLGTNEALRVTADGEFIWHPEADAMIEYGDFTSSPAMRHILRALRKALAAPVQEPAAWNTGVPPLYPEMKDGETISVEYTTLPAQPAPVQEPVAGQPLPCPFCGHIGLDFSDGETYRWGVASCGGCGASCGDVRREYPDQGEWHNEAIAEWNRRSPAAPDLQAELDATNRQVEILSDALAESRREVAALKVNAALDKMAENARALGLDYEPVGWWDSKIGFFEEKHFDQLQPLYTTPPAAQRQWVGLKPGEAEAFYNQFAKYQQEGPVLSGWFQFTKAIEAKLKELNT